MKRKADIKKKLQEVEKSLIEDSKDVFLYWLGFKRALEWILK